MKYSQGILYRTQIFLKDILHFLGNIFVSRNHSFFKQNPELPLQNEKKIKNSRKHDLKTTKRQLKIKK